MNELLRAYRQKFPSYNNVPDDELIVAVGEKYPQFLKDDAFRADYERASGGVDETPGKLATFGREAVAGVVPSAAAGGGAVAVGALLGTMGAGPIGTALGMLAGGVISGLAADKVQSAALDELAPEFQEARRAGAEANPWSAIGGNVLSAAPSFVVSPGSALGKLGKVVRGEATRSEALEALAPVALGSVTAAGVPVVLEGRAPTIQEVVGGTVQAIIYGEPRFGAKGRAAAAAASKLTPEAIAKDDAETRSVVGKTRKEPESIIPPPDAATATEAVAAARQQELVQAADFWATMDTADPRVEQLVRDNYGLSDAEMTVVRGDLGAAIQRVKARELAAKPVDDGTVTASAEDLAKAKEFETGGVPEPARTAEPPPPAPEPQPKVEPEPVKKPAVENNAASAVKVADETPKVESEPVTTRGVDPAPPQPSARVNPMEVAAAKDKPPEFWEKLAEDLTGDLDSFSPARNTGKINYELSDMAQRFVDFAKEDTSGRPLSDLVKDFAKIDDASPSQIKKLKASLQSVMAEQPVQQATTRNPLAAVASPAQPAAQPAAKPALTEMSYQTGQEVPHYGRLWNVVKTKGDRVQIRDSAGETKWVTGEQIEMAKRMWEVHNKNDTRYHAEYPPEKPFVPPKQSPDYSFAREPNAGGKQFVVDIDQQTGGIELAVDAKSGANRITLIIPTGLEKNGLYHANTVMALVPPSIMDPRVGPRTQIQLKKTITGKTASEVRYYAAKEIADRVNAGEFASKKQKQTPKSSVYPQLETKTIDVSPVSVENVPAAKPAITIPKDASFARVQTPTGGDMIVSAKDIPTLLKDGAIKPAAGDTITFGNKRAKGGEFVPLEKPAPIKPTDATKAAIADAKARVKKAVEKSQRMGATADPKQIAQTQAEFYHALYDLATNCIKLGVQTAAEFAKQIGMELTAALQRAFDDAKSGKRNPPSAVDTAVPESLRSGTTRQHAVAENVGKGRTEASESVRAAVKEMPEYWQSSNRLKREQAAAMKTEELSAIPSGDPMYFPAKAEIAKRLDRDGKHEQANDAWRQLAEAARTMGQQTAYLKELYSDPFYYLQRVSRSLMEAGFDPLTVEKKSALKTLADAAKKAEDAKDAAVEKFAKNKTEENYLEAVKADKASEEADLALQSKTAAMLPRSAWATLKAILQGNLIAPISQVANVTGNVAFTPFRSAARGFSTVTDYLDAFINKRNRQLAVLTPAEAAGNLAKATPWAAKKAVSILKEGSGRNVKGEDRQGLHPLEAWRDMAVQAAEAPTINGNLTMGQKADIWLQRTFGMTAEPMLRMLAGMDVLAREPAWLNVVSREAKVREVNGKVVPLTAAEAAQAAKFPEVFFSPEAVSRMRAEADAAVFQRESQTIRMINGWMHKQGPFADFMYATIAPYKLTPWNIIGEIFSYNPVVATATMFNKGAQSRSVAAKAARSRALGNEREAGAQQALADTLRRDVKIAAGKFFVGSVLSGAAWYLYKKGILSPSFDASDEAIKTRIQAGDILPPNHINISALGRLLDGGSAAPQKGDTTVDVFRAGGLAGAFMYMAANIGRDMERSRDVDGEKILWSLAQDSTLEMGRYGINQSFLKGVAGVLEAFREGRADQVVSNWINGIISVPLPNTLAAVSRATRPYKPDTKADSFSGKFANAVANRLGGAMGLDAYMPLKRDVWGRPMEETPAGRNAYAYHFADVFKFQQASDSPLDMEVYRLARTTGDTAAIPSIPKPELAVRGKLYTLDRNEYSKLAEVVGAERRRVAELMVTNPNFHTAPDAVKLKLLQRAYDVGERRGRGLFMRAIGNPRTVLDQKPKREGFTPS